MAGSLATRITISADDKASGVFRKVGDEADKTASRLMGVGASASRAFSTVGLDFGGSELGRFMQQMSTLTNQVSILRKQSGDTFAVMKSSLQENIVLMGRDTQAYIANTQAAVANGHARLDYLDKAITANKVMIAEIQRDPQWKWKIDSSGVRDIQRVSEITQENNQLIAEQSLLSRQLETQKRNLAVATEMGTGRMAKFGVAMNSLKTGAVGLINFMGGPWIIGISLAAAAIGYLATADSAAEKAAKAYGTTLDDVNKRYKDLVTGADSAATATLKASAVFRQAQQEWYADLQGQVEKAKSEVDRLAEYAGGVTYEPFAGLEVKNVYGVSDELMQRLQDINKELQTGTITAAEAEIEIGRLRGQVEKTGGMSSFSKILEQMQVHLAFVAQNADKATEAVANFSREQEALANGWKLDFFDLTQADSLEKAIDGIQFKIEQLGRSKAAQSLFDVAQKEGIDTSKIRVTGGVVSVDDGAASMAQITLLQSYLNKQEQLIDRSDALRKKASSSRGGSASSALREQQTALRTVNDELARLTMTEEAYNRFKFDEKIAEYERLNVPAEKIKEYTDAWNAAQESEKQVKNSELMADFEKDFLTVMKGSEAAQIASIQERAQIYRDAGADAVRVAQWQSEQELRYSRKATDGMISALQDYSSAAENMAKNTSSVITNAFDGMANAFSFTTQGMKFEWKSLIDSMLNDIARSMILKPLTGAIASGLGSIASGFFGSGGDMGASFGSGTTEAMVYGMHGGGKVGIDASFYRSVPASLFADAPRFHSGGQILRHGERPIIAEVGEVMLSNQDVVDIVREKNKTDKPTGPITLIVDLKNESSEPMQAKSQQTQWSNDMKSAVVTIVLDAVNRNYMGARDALRG